MSEPSRELLIACSQISGEEYERWGGTPEVEGAITAAAGDRLALARQFADWAGRVASAPDSEMDTRSAISRAYYACHHAARALSLYRDRRDQFDHYRAIESLAKTVGNEGHLRARLGPGEELRGRLLTLIDQRHLADYSPYTAAEPTDEPLDFTMGAAMAADLAREVVNAVEEFVAYKEAGKR